MKLAVVTVGRSDYGILRPLVTAIAENPAFELCLIVGDAHNDDRYGVTGQDIKDDGFSVASTVACMPSGGEALDIATAIGQGVSGFAQAYQLHQPDVLVVLGDRYETLASVVAAQPFLIPVVHIGGGALTQGALDDGFRHAITKLSHLHCVETTDHADIVRQMGENPNHIIQVGALGLDNIATIPEMDKTELERFLGVTLDQAPILVTIHPETHSRLSAVTLAQECFNALENLSMPAIVTYPNADQDGQILIAAIDDFARGREDWFHVRPHLGTKAYFSLMRRARIMIGNSSSGIIEAGAFGLGVVNIGDRQKGRVCGPNVLHCPVEARAITEAATEALALSAEARDPSRHVYGQGGVAAKILQKIQSVNDFPSLVMTKQFQRFDL